MKRTGIDLFAGIGGFSLAMQRNGVQVHEQVEIDPYALRVLEKNFPEAKRHGDIKTYHPTINPWIVCGGFPCQDISSANRSGKGLEGARSGLWREMLRIIALTQPVWVLIENVPELINKGIDEVLTSLEEIDYASESIRMGAIDLGYPNKRERIWIVSNANGKRLETIHCKHVRPPERFPEVAYVFENDRPNERPKHLAHKPGLGRTIAGIPGGVVKHRIKAMGNAINVHCAELVIAAIIQTEQANKRGG